MTKNRKDNKIGGKNTKSHSKSYLLREMMQAPPMPEKGWEDSIYQRAVEDYAEQSSNLSDNTQRVSDQDKKLFGRIGSTYRKLNPLSPNSKNSLGSLGNLSAFWQNIKLPRTALGPAALGIILALVVIAIYPQLDQTTLLGPAKQGEQISTQTNPEQLIPPNSIDDSIDDSTDTPNNLAADEYLMSEFVVWNDIINPDDSIAATLYLEDNDPSEAESLLGDGWLLDIE